MQPFTENPDSSILGYASSYKGYRIFTNYLRCKIGQGQSYIMVISYQFLHLYNYQLLQTCKYLNIIWYKVLNCSYEYVYAGCAFWTQPFPASNSFSSMTTSIFPSTPTSFSILAKEKHNAAITVFHYGMASSGWCLGFCFGVGSEWSQDFLTPRKTRKN